MKIPRQNSSSPYVVMERRNSQVGERLRLKDRILESINKAIKQIQEQQFCSGEEILTLCNEDRLLKKLCEHLDHAFLHGLRHITDGYWQVAQEFTRKEAIKEISRLTKVTTHLGRGRAWLYMALCENLLECYIKCFSENAKVVGKYYVKDALLLDDQRLHILLTMTAGLEFVTFDLDYDVPYLDLASYMPSRKPSHAHQGSEGDAEERLSLCSMNSDISQMSLQDTIPRTTSFDVESVGSLNNNTRPLDLNLIVPSDNSSLDSMRTAEYTSVGQSQPYSRSPSLTFENDVRSRFMSLDMDDISAGQDLEVIRVKSKSKGRKRRSNSKRKEEGEESVPASPRTPSTPEVPRFDFPASVEKNSDMPKLDEIAELSLDNLHFNATKLESVECVDGCDSSSAKTIEIAGQLVKLREKSSQSKAENDNLTFKEKRGSFTQILDVAFVPSAMPKENGLLVTDQSEGSGAIAPFGKMDKSGSATSEKLSENVAEGGEVCDRNEKESNVCASVPREENIEKESRCVKDKGGLNISDDNSKKYLSILEHMDSESFDIYAMDSSQTSRIEKGKLHKDLVLPEVPEISLENPTPEASNHACVSPYVDLYCQDGEIHSQILNKSDIEAKEKRTGGIGAESSPKKTCALKKPLDLAVGQYLDPASMREEGDGASQGSPDDGNGHDGRAARQVVSPDQHLHEAEIKVDNNSMLFLMLDVFQDQDEQFIKMYHTSLGHMEGDAQPIFVLLTDRALYLLGRHMGGPRYRKEAVIKYMELDYISLSMNCQIINIVCTNRRKQFWITTGDEELTKNIVSQLDLVVRQSESDLPRLSVLTDATVQKIGLRKWVSQDCRCQPSEVELHSYALVHWEDAASNARPARGVGKEGTLLYKAQGYFGGPTWKPAFFVLKDGVLYHYNDRHDNSLPKLCVQLNSEDCGGCRRCTTTDREHCIEILLANGGSLQMSAANSADAQSWLQCLCQAVAEGVTTTVHNSSCLACCLVLTQNKVLMCHEDVQTNFFRTLGSGDIEDITAITTDPGARTYCIIEFESQDARVSSEQWVLYFNSKVEANKFMDALSSVWAKIFQVSIPVQRITDVVLQKRCREGVARLRAAMKQYSIER
ncbi:pleckstrin homology domain-containing family M member 2-like [Lineus longissimus]|uniref:pleckstrin homology domain-containing family M member 2-like n=1 Tax=Lineus longissimus TaxID=88925 RepID=UPI002B4F4AB9